MPGLDIADLERKFCSGMDALVGPGAVRWTEQLHRPTGPGFEDAPRPVVPVDPGVRHTQAENVSIERHRRIEIGDVENHVEADGVDQHPFRGSPTKLATVGRDRSDAIRLLDQPEDTGPPPYEWRIAVVLAVAAVAVLIGYAIGRTSVRPGTAATTTIPITTSSFVADTSTTATPSTVPSTTSDPPPTGPLPLDALVPDFAGTLAWTTTSSAHRWTAGSAGPEVIALPRRLWEGTARWDSAGVFIAYVQPSAVSQDGETFGALSVGTMFAQQPVELAVESPQAFAWHDSVPGRFAYLRVDTAKDVLTLVVGTVEPTSVTTRTVAEFPVPGYDSPQQPLLLRAYGEWGVLLESRTDGMLVVDEAGATTAIDPDRTYFGRAGPGRVVLIGRLPEPDLESATVVDDRLQPVEVAGLDRLPELLLGGAVWTADGTRVVYQAGATESGDGLVILNADGTEMRRDTGAWPIGFDAQDRYAVAGNERLVTFVDLESGAVFGVELPASPVHIQVH